MIKYSPLVLIILDGFGIGPSYAGNSIQLANMKFYNSLLKEYPNSKLNASGESVGLPKDEDGNSEVGHLNLGAGKIVYQDLPRINMSIADASFFKNEAFLKAIEHVKKNNSSLHLLGLIGSGGVHSNIEHLFALLHLAKKNGLKKVYLHLFTDGRDSAPTSALIYIKQLENEISNNNVGEIASLIGRYYAMDRDKRWDRTLKAYKLFTEGEGKTYSTPEEAILAAYKRNETDEFLQASTVTNKTGNYSHSRIKPGDGVIFFNFRVDRPRQLAKMFTLPVFDEKSVLQSDYDPFTERYGGKQAYDFSSDTDIPERGKKISDLFFVTMTQYDKNLDCHIAYPLEDVKIPLGRVIAENKLKQLHITESEKEKMITYFFNGLREDPFPDEDRTIVSSPKVTTYDKKPEMSADEIADTMINKLRNKNYDFTVVNFANPDMLGHTGNIEQTIVALGKIDENLKKVFEEVVIKQCGTIMITADHGNCEEMIDKEGNIDTKHSNYPVPFVLINNNLKHIKVHDGILGDVAPTILQLLNLKKPEEMTGRNLIEGDLPL